MQSFPALAINKKLRSFSVEELVKLSTTPSYWSTFLKLKQLAHQPRYQAAAVDIHGISLKLIDATSFLAMYDEIFAAQIYKFKAETQQPVILDVGANIGLSVLYFKQLYPDSQITAFEPDPTIFSVLQHNVQQARLSNVTLINKAVWNSETTLEFMAEGADGGRMVQLDSDAATVKVNTVRLRDFLTQPIDFLKIDIEGAETEVLLDCEPQLHCVRQLFVEYHSFSDQPQSLPQLAAILNRAGFRLYICPAISQPQPLYQRTANLGMDVQLNLFAFRAD